MTPKEKAKELVDKIMELQLVSNKLYLPNMTQEIVKQCALIAVENEYNAKIQAYNEMAEFCTDVAMQAVVYAQIEKEEVEQEIQKL